MSGHWKFFPLIFSPFGSNLWAVPFKKAFWMLWVGKKSVSHKAEEKVSKLQRAFILPLTLSSSLLLFIFSLNSWNSAPLQRKDCTLVSRFVPSLNYAYECWWKRKLRQEDLVLRVLLRGQKIGKYGYISITLQIVIPKWMTMDKKE